jgi:hypothetical protein
LLPDSPNAEKVVHATNEQGVVAGETIDDFDETIDSLANTTAIRIGD